MSAGGYPTRGDDYDMIVASNRLKKGTCTLEMNLHKPDTFYSPTNLEMEPKKNVPKHDFSQSKSTFGSQPKGKDPRPMIRTTRGFLKKMDPLSIGGVMGMTRGWNNPNMSGG